MFIQLCLHTGFDGSKHLFIWAFMFVLFIWRWVEKHSWGCVYAQRVHKHTCAFLVLWHEIALVFTPLTYPKHQHKFFTPAPAPFSLRPLIFLTWRTHWLDGHAHVPSEPFALSCAFAQFQWKIAPSWIVEASSSGDTDNKHTSLLPLSHVSLFWGYCFSLSK